MLKRITLAFCLTLLVKGLAAQSVYDPKALEILEAVSENYKTIPVFKAQIAKSLVNDLEGLNDKFDGEVIVKGDKFRLTFVEQEIVSNGKVIWTYIPDEDFPEVTIDNYNPETSDINPTKILNAYKKGFKYLYLNDIEEGGKVYQLIDLISEDKNAVFFKIRLQIDKTGQLLKKWTIFEKDTGTRIIFEVNNFTTGINPGEDVFEFDVEKYDDIVVVDMRLDN